MGLLLWRLRSKSQSKPCTLRCGEQMHLHVFLTDVKSPKQHHLTICSCIAKSFYDHTICMRQHRNENVLSTQSLYKYYTQVHENQMHLHIIGKYSNAVMVMHCLFNILQSSVYINHLDVLQRFECMPWAYRVSIPYFRHGYTYFGNKSITLLREKIDENIVRQTELQFRDGFFPSGTKSTEKQKKVYIEMKHLSVRRASQKCLLNFLRWNR